MSSISSDSLSINRGVFFHLNAGDANGEGGSSSPFGAASTRESDVGVVVIVVVVCAVAADGVVVVIVVVAVSLLLSAD